MLDYIKSIFGLFFQATKQIEKNVVKETQGALWETVVFFKCLIQQLEE